jgi:trans-aconitate 2-methyltransferase
MPWDPDLFLRFKNERFAPFEDLIRMVHPRQGITAVDLGCGTGELTARLKEYLPDSKVTGIDSSPQMLERARNLESTGLNFELGKIEDFSGSYDLIFSHAAIHWVPDHPALIHRFFTMLKPGGQIAVQLPSNSNHPAMSAIRYVAAEEPFVSTLHGWHQPLHVLPIDEYADILYNEGGKEITVFEKIYPHILPDVDALAQWTSATAMLPYLEKLSEPTKQEFVSRYKEVLSERFTTTPIFFGFKRILFSATLR